MGRRSGLDLDLLYKVIKDGAGTSRMSKSARTHDSPRLYDATMKIDVYQKDIDIIGAYAQGCTADAAFRASKVLLGRLCAGACQARHGVHMRGPKTWLA